MSRKYLEYWGGYARSPVLDSLVWVAVLAYEAQDALERYKECIARHDDVEALENPQMAPGSSNEQYLSEEQLHEFHEFHSVIAFPTRSV